MGKKLNAQLIQMRCKTDKLEVIDKINLWGNDLEDISILRQMKAVRVVSLSLNKINTLEDFAYCQSLTELYLRKNEIRDLNEIQYLSNLPNLQVLWLSENPISAHPRYRLFVLKTLPNLRKLDEVEVTQEEIEIAASMNFDENELEISNMSQIPSMPQALLNPQAPSLPQPDQFYQNDQYSYETPDKPKSFEMAENSGPGHPMQRSPPQVMQEDAKLPYQGMLDQPQIGSNMPKMWSKGPTGAEVYAGGMPQNYDMPPPELKRAQTTGPFYNDNQPPLRYGMNETGNYLPPPPRMVHAHSTPMASPGPGVPPNGGKYKNENIL
jgi:hypothetical protein